MKNENQFSFSLKMVGVNPFNYSFNGGNVILIAMYYIVLKSLSENA